MGVLNGLSYLLAGLVLWMAFVFRRPLGSPAWLYGSDPAQQRGRGRDIARAVGALLFLMLLDAVPDLIREATKQEPPGFLGPGYAYIVYFLGGWVAGRFGGRLGLYCTLAFIFLRVLIPLAGIPLGLFFIEEAPKSQVFVQRVMEQWLPLLLLGPQALVYTLGAAMWGAWQAYGSKRPAKDSEAARLNGSNASNGG